MTYKQAKSEAIGFGAVAAFALAGGIFLLAIGSPFPWPYIQFFLVSYYGCKSWIKAREARKLHRLMIETQDSINRAIAKVRAHQAMGKR